MIALIDQYRKELENIRIYAPDTVQVYTSCIQAMMGHASIAETAIYIHVSDKLQQQALNYVSTSGRVSWQ